MWLITILFLIIGLALVFGGRSLQRDAKRAASWPVTPGKIERCEVIEKPGVGRDDFSTWDLQLEYSYVVRGVTYHSTRYAFGYGGGNDDKKYRAVADSLNRSPEISVHYDPRHPREAVISTEIPTQIATLGNFLLVMAAISALIAMAKS